MYEVGYITTRLYHYTEYNATDGKIYDVTEKAFYVHPYGFPMMYKVIRISRSEREEQ